MKKKVKMWVRKALEDFKTAEHEMNLPKSETVTSSVCFHSQQFVEKMLKAFLTSKGNEEFFIGTGENQPSNFARNFEPKSLSNM